MKSEEIEEVPIQTVLAPPSMLARYTCASILASSATCTIVVNFSPTTSATYNTNLSLDYANGAATVNSPCRLVVACTMRPSVELTGSPA